MTLQSDGRAAGDPEIAALAPWFHNVHLPDGRETAPDHPLGDFPRFKWQALGQVLPASLEGMRVLDIGCNAGFYSVELARRGASVVAIDHDEHYLRQAAWITSQFELQDRIELRHLGVYDLARVREVFDVVLFLGVFYHLRYPLLALDLVAERVGGMLLFQTLSLPEEERAEISADVDIDRRDLLLSAGWPRMAFVEHRLAGDPTNWWVPNASAVEAMIRSTGLTVVSEPAHEFWMCRRDEASDHTVELDHATGRISQPPDVSSSFNGLHNVQ